jgi:membrane fusion protein, multidrug efflux system
MSSKEVGSQTLARQLGSGARAARTALWAWLFAAAGHHAFAADPAKSTSLPALATAVVQNSQTQQASGFDGVVEAVRQTALAAQVAGAVVAIEVKAGDRVQAGQVLLRIDARAANQSAAASNAQVQAARAALDLAKQDFGRQELLFKQNFISQAAFEQARAQFASAQAQALAQQAQAGASLTQTGFFVVKAPYAGVVSDVPVALGDMAMPGRALLTLHDPQVLRVNVTLPQSAASALTDSTPVKLQFPGMAAAREWLLPTRQELLPTVDAQSHTATLRLYLPAGTAGLSPGQFARAWLPVAVAGGARLEVPAASVVRRAEMTGLYVVGNDGRALLRQVRLGPLRGDRVEVLSGVSAGERVALDPQAAARASQSGAGSAP